jgi:hypothetical protein
MGSLQLRGFRLGSAENWNVKVSIFPEREEILTELDCVFAGCAETFQEFRSIWAADSGDLGHALVCPPHLPKPPLCGIDLFWGVVYGGHQTP